MNEKRDSALEAGPRFKFSEDLNMLFDARTGRKYAAVMSGFPGYCLGCAFLPGLCPGVCGPSARRPDLRYIVWREETGT